MTDMAFWTASETVDALKAGSVSSVEVTEHLIARIEQHDDAVNAVVVRDFDRARDAARQADSAHAHGKHLGPLHGLPLTVKEAYDVQGLPTTWGIPALAENVAATDAAVVRKLREAGAHLLGKTNVPLELADFQSYNDIYGTTNNPWELGRTPGGSSGGSAAALAAGFTPLEMGSDIGGSIRNPAHFCGVYGHKPTWGVVSSKGHALPGQLAEPDIAVVGPLARSAEDLALAFGIVAGADDLMSPGWQLTLPSKPQPSLGDLRVAVWPTDERAPVSSEVVETATTVANALKDLGATVSFDARADIDLDESYETYVALLNGVMGAGIPTEARAAAREQAATLDPNDRSFAANSMRYAGIDHGDWLRMHHRRTQLRHQWRSFFADWDILLCPIAASAAFPHDHRPMGERTIEINGEQQPYFDQLFWAGTITVAQLPSTVFPAGRSASGLPIGLQAVGAEFADNTTIEFARLITQELGGFTAPPRFV